MPRVTTATRALYDELVKAGAWSLSDSQLQASIEARLGPPPEVADTTAHWRALDGLAAGRTRRLPESDEAAIDLAIAGCPCLRLPNAVRRIIAATDGPNDPDSVAEQVMADVQADGDSFGARLARHAFTRAKARPGSTGEDARLERHGQVQAVITELSEVAEGASPTRSIDPDDMAQTFGMPPELVRAFLPAFELTFGNHDVLPAVDSLVMDAGLATLARAVRGAAALVPLFENAIVRLDTSNMRTRFIAQTAPLLLAASELHEAVVAQAGGADLAESLPSMFSGDSPELIRARESLRPLVRRPPSIEAPPTESP